MRESHCCWTRYPNIILSNRLQPMAIVWKLRVSADSVFPFETLLQCELYDFEKWFGKIYTFGIDGLQGCDASKSLQGSKHQPNHEHLLPVLFGYFAVAIERDTLTLWYMNFFESINANGWNTRRMEPWVAEVTKEFCNSCSYNDPSNKSWPRLKDLCD